MTGLHQQTKPPQISCVALRKCPPSDSRTATKPCARIHYDRRGAPQRRKPSFREILSIERGDPPPQGMIRPCGRAGDPTYCLARTIHECRREAFETEARRGCSHVRPTQAYWQSVEEAEREQPRRARGSDAGAAIHEEPGLGNDVVEQTRLNGRKRPRLTRDGRKDHGRSSLIRTLNQPHRELRAKRH